MDERTSLSAVLAELVGLPTLHERERRALELLPAVGYDSGDDDPNCVFVAQLLAALAGLEVGLAAKYERQARPDP